MTFDIEPELLDRFLTLFAAHYEEFELATAFLESHEQVSNLPSFLNVRDALSHFVTALEQGLPAEKRREQYPHAEEHFRRAIIEPYQLALNARLLKYEEVERDYRATILPRRKRYAWLEEFPDDGTITVELAEIRNLIRIGRNGKRGNRWSKEFNEGVSAFIEAYQRLVSLQHELERGLAEFRAYQKERTDRWLAIGGVAVGLFGVAVAVLSWLL